MCQASQPGGVRVVSFVYVYVVDLDRLQWGSKVTDFNQWVEFLAPGHLGPQPGSMGQMGGQIGGQIGGQMGQMGGQQGSMGGPIAGPIGGPIGGPSQAGSFPHFGCAGNGAKSL